MNFVVCQEMTAAAVGVFQYWFDNMAVAVQGLRYLFEKMGVALLVLQCLFEMMTLVPIKQITSILYKI